jgi:hypothetical protein
MITLISLLIGFIFLSQTVIILFYMCAKKRLNKYLYKKWIIDRYNINKKEKIYEIYDTV